MDQQELDTRMLQLAARGAAELPNDPFRAFAQVELTEPKKLKARQRRELGAAEAAFAADMAGRYTSPEGSTDA